MATAERYPFIFPDTGQTQPATTRNGVNAGVPVCDSSGKSRHLLISSMERGQRAGPVRRENIKTEQKSGNRLICLSLPITMGTIALPGCVDSGQDRNSGSKIKIFHVMHKIHYMRPFMKKKYLTYAGIVCCRNTRHHVRGHSPDRLLLHLLHG